MTDILDIYGQHTVTLIYAGGYDDYGREQDETRTELSGVWVDESRRNVLDANNAQTLSEATITIPLSTDTKNLAAVILPSGRRARLIATKKADPGNLPLPAHTTLYVE